MGSKWFSKLGIALAGIAMAVGVGVGLGQKEFKRAEAVDAVYESCDMTAKTASCSGYTKVHTYGDYEIYGGQNNSNSWEYFKFGGKKSKAADPDKVTNAYVKTNNAIDEAVTRVGIVVGTGSLDGSVEVSLDVASDAAFANIIATVELDEFDHTTTGTTFIYPETPSTNWAAGKYYRVNLTCTNATTTNGMLTLNSIDFYAESTSTITGVSINGVNNHAMSVSSGYLGRKTVQLAATVTQSGTGLSTAVTWTSADSTKMSVNSSTGLVTIKANNETVRITATSIADGNYYDYVDITSSNIVSFAGTTVSTNYDNQTMGNSNIVSQSNGDLADVAGSMSNVVANVDKSNGDNNPGFYYNNPPSLRVYGDASKHNKMTISVPASNKIYWIDFTSDTGYEFNSSRATIVTGSGTIISEATSAYIDCTANAVNSITLSFSGTIRIRTMSISYDSDTLSTVSIDMSGATSTNFDLNSTFTASTAAASHIVAYANYAGGSRVDVTSSATWNLDTSVVGTSALTATYDGKTSAGVNVTIVEGVVHVDEVNITQDSVSFAYAEIGQTSQLTWTVSGEGGETPTDSSVSFTSSVPGVASVSSTGLVTALAVGNTTITITTADGGLTDTCSVTVADYVGDYALLTNTNQLWEGREVVVGIINPNITNDDYAMLHYVGNNIIGTTNATYSTQRTSMTPSTAATYTVGLYGNRYTLSYVVEETTYYLAQTASKNQAKAVTTFDPDTCAFEIEISNAGVASIKAPTQVDYSGNPTYEYLAFNLNQDPGDNTKARFAFYPGINDSIAKVSLYATSAVETAEEQAKTFIYREMHIRDIDPEDESDTNACRSAGDGAQNYYNIAKSIWNSNDFAAARAIIVAGSGDYAKAVERLGKWALANGESLNDSTKILGASTNGGLIKTANESNNDLLLAIVIIAGVSALAVGGYFFIRRKHQ